MTESILTKVAVVSLLCLSGWTGAAQGAPTAERPFAALQSLDGQVATIGHRLAVANLDFCREQVWRPGFVLHDLGQYGPDDRAAAARHFGLDAGPAVLALATGGPAERAGLRIEDIVLRVDGLDTASGALPPRASFDRMERTLDMLDQAFADGAATLEIRRSGSAVTITIQGERGCATHFQVVPSERLNALADGRYVQLTTAIGAYATNDQELAAVIAHEFAHNILHHRARLDATGVARGFFGNFGRNARLIRETEIEADRLSIYLLDRAGYDVDAAVRFWERFGRRGLNFLGSPTHGSWRTRIAALREEAERVRQARARGGLAVPSFLPVAIPSQDGPPF
ncbi:M48 family metallopeptidase [Sphingosinicella sp. LHD-64]|uniref:M48 family metallopeptidase n=1 Tax=Sphingosinicella sp. LHD-64 TaxID=3072139 RepID=UPI00280C4EF9|nr:M48 family metallopeptidase [Sphingosinicella sp. LHD-64]MDQ8757213.1 M48 family metallopeptidase [Sphingosinicella sp. LHD-64]